MSSCCEGIAIIVHNGSLYISQIFGAFIYKHSGKFIKEVFVAPKTIQRGLFIYDVAEACLVIGSIFRASVSYAKGFDCVEQDLRLKGFGNILVHPSFNA